VAEKQWQTGKAVKGEHSNQHLWAHLRRQNVDAAHKTAQAIVEVCEKYPGCVLVFERLRKIKASGGSKSRRLNRKQANQLKGKINQLAKEKAYAIGIVSCETNAYGTSQYCSRCGAKGERFSRKGSVCIIGQGGKLFRCRACSYEVQADWNASVNVHHSFFREYHWQPRVAKSG
jgi:IS605 OrfB family transposase